MDTKNELEKFYGKISEEVKGFFLNPEEKWTIGGTLKKVIKARHQNLKQSTY